MELTIKQNEKLTELNDRYYDYHHNQATPLTDEELEDNAVTSGLRNMWLPREIEIAKTMIEHIMD